MPREVTFEQGQAFSDKHQLSGFAETSAKTGSSVDKAFCSFAQQLHAHWLNRLRDEGMVRQRLEVRGLSLSQEREKDRKRCKC